jgi:hypothetical protein
MPSELDAALGMRIIAVLMSSPAQSINFTLGSIHVDHAGFRSVVSEISNWIAGDEGIAVKWEKLDADTEASYNRFTKQYIFPYSFFGMVDFQKAAIVHESVHALVGLRHPITYTAKGPLVVKATENEAAAYLAEALYLRFATALPLTDNPIVLKANEIAGNIMNVKNAIVPERDAATLRTLITAHPTYAKKGMKFNDVLRLKSPLGPPFEQR